MVSPRSRARPRRPDVVRLRPGEVMEGGGVVLVGEDAQVHLQPVLHADRALAVALAEDLAHAHLAGEDREHRSGLGCRGDDVHVGDQLAPAPDAARPPRRAPRRGGPHLREQRLGDGRTSPSRRRACAERYCSMPARIFCSLRSPKPLSPRTRWSRQACSSCSMLPTPRALCRAAAFFAPRSRQAQQLEDARAGTRPGAARGAGGSGPVELGDLLRQGRSDVGELGETALAHQGVQIAAEAGHPVCAEVVGA